MLLVASLLLCFVLIGSFLYSKHIQPHAQPRSQPDRSSFRHDGPVAALAQLHGEGRVYLVDMGARTQSYGARKLADWLRAKYRLDVVVLPPVALERAAWDSPRDQYVAELVGEELEHTHPELAAEPNASLIGITEESMYRAHAAEDQSYTARVNEQVAVISTYGFQAHGLWQRLHTDPDAAPQVQAMLRRLVLKNVAMLHWHLAPNNDATSLLHDPLNPALRAEDIYASDLDPEAMPWGAAMNNPCLYFTYSAGAGMRAMPAASESGLRPCTYGSPASSDESQETIEVDLIHGVVRDLRTDLYLPDSIPLEFQRVLRPGGTNPTEFGVSGSHSFDKYLWADDMSELHEVGPEFINVNLRRIPVWLPVESLNKWVDEDYSGRLLTMDHHLTPHEHFDLHDLHGNVESYLPCDGPQTCYLESYRNAQGQEIHFKRKGEDRRLLQLTSPNGSWLKFTYDAAARLMEVDDSRGRSVHYGYNAASQLVRVVHAGGEVVSYAYDAQQRLLSLSAAPDGTSPPQQLLRNTYDTSGRLVRQTLPDGAVYSYVHHSIAGESNRWMTVTGPDGHTVDMLSRGSQASLWSASLQGRPGASQLAQR